MKQLLLIVGSILIMTLITSAHSNSADDAPFWMNGMTADEFVAIEDGRLKQAQAAIDRMLAVKGKRTIENTLVPFDDAYVYLDAASQQPGLMQVVHPDEAFRTAAEKVSQKVAAFTTDISLN